MSQGRPHFILRWLHSILPCIGCISDGWCSGLITLFCHHIPSDNPTCSFFCRRLGFVESVPPPRERSNERNIRFSSNRTFLLSLGLCLCLFSPSRRISFVLCAPLAMIWVDRTIYQGGGLLVKSKLNIVHSTIGTDSLSHLSWLHWKPNWGAEAKDANPDSKNSCRISDQKIGQERG